MKEIYFDNSSTTIVSPEAARIVMKVMTEDYGNPSSMHLKGVAAEKYVREARVKIAKTLRAKENEIYFTSGGSESNNWALIGGARGQYHPHERLRAPGGLRAAEVPREPGISHREDPGRPRGEAQAGCPSGEDDGGRDPHVLHVCEQRDRRGEPDRGNRENENRALPQSPLSCGRDPGLRQVPDLPEGAQN